MIVGSDRERRFALWRGLLCLVLTATFWLSPFGDANEPVEFQAHDQVSDADATPGGSMYGRGTPRIVKRSVGTDHLAVNAAVPDIVLLSSPESHECDHERGDASPRVLRHRHPGTSVRGPPQA